jgi:6-phosphogluconolactonase
LRELGISRPNSGRLTPLAAAHALAMHFTLTSVSTTGVHMHNPPRRRFAVQLSAIALASTVATPSLAGDDEHSSSFRENKIFTSTNAPGGNELLVFAAQRGGELALMARAATNGQGTGAGLGSQGAVTLGSDGRHVFVVNALSNTVSTFALRNNGLALMSVVDSGGLQPTSVTEHDGLVYVLNAGGAGNVAGFRNAHGELRPLANSSRGLSAAGGTAPAQVGFGADGEVLVVTERTSNRITSYAVRRNGTLGPAVVTASSGATPFGFAFDRRDHLIVSEAPGSAASSYRFDERTATPTLLSASVANTQAAACWVAVTPNGRFAFTANAGSSSISSYRIARSGRIELANAVAGSTGANAGALDIAVSPDGRRLFALASRSLQVVAFGIGSDGDLSTLGAGSGLPAGSAGMAAN